MVVGLVFFFLSLQMISLLPEEWKPGETLFGCPWQAVVITALVGLLTFTLFFWRTVLAVSVVILLLCLFGACKMPILFV